MFIHACKLQSQARERIYNLRARGKKKTTHTENPKQLHHASWVFYSAFLHINLILSNVEYSFDTEL